MRKDQQKQVTYRELAQSLYEGEPPAERLSPAKAAEEAAERIIKAIYKEDRRASN